MSSPISSLYSHDAQLAPELSVVSWLNTKAELTLSALRGKVVMLDAFQMLCPGCVLRSLPQASSLASLFEKDAFQVLGLHSVFEHHDVMTTDTLEAFVYEYKLSFPITIDRHSTGTAIPQTMLSYEMVGTPTTVLIDKSGKIRARYFGSVKEEKVAAQIGYLLAEP